MSCTALADDANGAIYVFDSSELLGDDLKFTAWPQAWRHFFVKIGA